ncbi:hypothetical protein PoB_003917400 [Plakobranchus ocellatus]|uniref:Uncharacterized protein n=1 Tax=Plakobranchus ocellatus TaxID=259542 RepID=A0AAV4B1V6_9GAST|nr:hypothetical protein PoB_003917400 [Plakobranchus ocellatus]
MECWDNIGTEIYRGGGGGGDGAAGSGGGGVSDGDVDIVDEGDYGIGCGSEFDDDGSHGAAVCSDSGGGGDGAAGSGGGGVTGPQINLRAFHLLARPTTAINLARDHHHRIAMTAEPATQL